MSILFTSDPFRLLCSFLLAAGIVWFSIPSIVHLSREKHLHKSASVRDSHDGAVPTLGGAAIFIAFGITSLIFLKAAFLPDLKLFMVALIIIFMLGVKDDLMVLTAFQKFIGELIAFDLLIFFGNVRITDLHGFMGIHEITMITSLLLTMLISFGIINSMNLIDGIDGLASGIAIIAISTFGTWFWMTGQLELVILSTALIGALLSFFYFNVFSKKNKIFMGDTGSLVLGYILTFFVIKFCESAVTAKTVLNLRAAPAVAMGILAIPIFDTLRVFWIRILRRQSPFHADRMHLHHILIQSGLSHLKATFILMMMNIFLILIAFAMQLFTANIIYIVIGLFVICVLMTEVFNHLKRKTTTG